MRKRIYHMSTYMPHVLQGTLQFEVARPRRGLAREYAIEHRALPVLFGIFAVLVVAYLYFVASSILNVMGRSDAERRIHDVQTNLAAIEQQYLALSSSLSSQSATDLGLSAIGTVSYVYRPGKTALVTYAGSDI